MQYYAILFFSIDSRRDVFLFADTFYKYRQYLYIYDTDTYVIIRKYRFEVLDQQTT